jgi:O-antigen ligase
MSRTGKEAEAAVLAKKSMAEGVYDYDLVNAAFVLGMRKGDYDMAIEALELRNKDWPAQRADGYLKLAGIYQNQKKNEAKTIASYKSAIDSALPAEKDAIRKSVPPAYLGRL